MAQLAPPSQTDNIPVVILAGGQSRRLQLDNKPKWQLAFDAHKTEQTLLSFIIKRLKKQTDHIIINGPFVKNEALNHYKRPIINDSLANFQGPLSGLLTALYWAKNNHQPWLATVSCDSPFFPEHLLNHLINGLNGQKAAIATHNGRTHPTFGLWSATLYEPLKQALEVQQIRAVNRWALQYSSLVEFNPQHIDKTKSNIPIDPFFNINTVADYQQALNYLHATN